MSTPDPLLEIENLKVIFRGDQGQTTHAVDCVNLAVERGNCGASPSKREVSIAGKRPKHTRQCGFRHR